jgi:hypothetical protein
MGNLSLQRSPWKFFNLQRGPSDSCLPSSSSVTLASPLLPFCHRRPSPVPCPKLHLQPLCKPTRRLRIFHRSTSSPLSSSPRAISLSFLFWTAIVTGRKPPPAHPPPGLSSRPKPQCYLPPHSFHSWWSIPSSPSLNCVYTDGRRPPPLPPPSAPRRAPPSDLPLLELSLGIGSPPHPRAPRPRALPILHLSLPEFEPPLAGATAPVGSSPPALSILSETLYR